MKIHPIKKVIDIQAPKEKVWEVVLQDRYTRIWYGEFSMGAHAETTWEEGSKVLFTDISGGGLIGQVVVNHPHKMVSVEYQGVVNAGFEEYDSKDAQLVKGGHETYSFSENGSLTQLTVETDMPDELHETMSQAWNKALRRIKELSENESHAA